MTELLQSTAQTVVGRGYLSSDHISTATGLDPAITISKNGGNFANPAAGASVMTEIESTGWYKFALGTGDTDTLGPLIIRGTHATMDNIEVVFQVVKEIADIAGGTIAISATQAASVSTGALAIRTHHTLSQAITSTTTSDLSAATKLWLTVKSNKRDTDAQSVVFIEATAGLTVLAGAPYITVAHGTLVVTGNAGAWTVTVGMDEIATGLLKDYAESMLWAECKALVGGSTVAVWDGVCDVSHGLVVAVA
jgi:hypothetical protein